MGYKLPIYSYCGNNPISYIDKDGNFAWFLAAAYMTYNYLHTYKDSPNFIHRLASSFFATSWGMASGEVGGAVTQSTGSVLAGRTAGASVNSLGHGGGPVVDLGVYSYDVKTGTSNFADFKGDNPLKWMGDAMGYASVMDEAFRIQKALNPGRERGEEDIARTQNATDNDIYYDEEGVAYIEVGSLPGSGGAGNLIDAIGGKGKSGYSDVQTFKMPKLLSQYSGKIRNLRTLWGHYKIGGFGKSIYEFHASKFSPIGLGGLMAVPHILFESGAWPGYNFRFNTMLPALTQIYRTSYIY
jgi:hypothetical protein